MTPIFKNAIKAFLVEAERETKKLQETLDDLEGKDEPDEDDQDEIETLNSQISSIEDVINYVEEL